MKNFLNKIFKKIYNLFYEEVEFQDLYKNSGVYKALEGVCELNAKGSYYLLHRTKPNEERYNTYMRVFNQLRALQKYGYIVRVHKNKKSYYYKMTDKGITYYNITKKQNA